MSKKIYISTVFVLVLLLASAGYSDIKIDFEDAEDPCTEPGYTAFFISDSGSDVNGIIIDLSGNLDDRRRLDPNPGNIIGFPINEEQIHRDFIFGEYLPINITLWGLGAGQKADIHIWAFDDDADDIERIANWTANGQELLTTSFIGGDYFKWPCDWNLGYEHYDFNGIATADDVGRIFLTCTQDPNSGTPYAYANALEVFTIGTPNDVVKAHRPVPFDLDEDVPADVTLSWIPGVGATSHDVYLGTDPDALVFQGNVSPNNFTPASFLALDKIYYWRVDEQPGSVTGDVWSFTTSNYVLVDDFEAYGWGGLIIRDHWDDYYANGTSSEVYITTNPALGEQSMEYRFLNGTYPPYYSEVSIDLTQTGVEIDTNFIGMDVQSLSIWFYGEETNPTTEQMYVTLSDGSETATVNYSDMDDITIEEWQEWNTSMAQFKADNASLDLTNIQEITIGFAEGAPADGTVYFDDIRLYTTRCVLSERSAGFDRVDYAPAGDPRGDCIVDNLELEKMIRVWGTAGVNIPKVVPDTNGLVAYYPFDDFNDANSVPDILLPDGVMLTRNMTPNIPHPNAAWAILSPIDPCEDPPTEGTVEIIRPGVPLPNRTDGNCVGFDSDGGEPGERIHCGRWPVVGNFEPGPGAYGQTGTAFQGKGELTLSIWVKWAGPHITRSKSQGLISKRAEWADDEMIWMFELDTIPGPRGSISLRQRYNGYSLYSAAGLMDLFIGQWVHLATVANITNDSNDAILYLNGAEVQRGTFYFSGGGPNMITLTIGNNAQIEHQGVESFMGELDEVYIYSRALEPGEIAYLTQPDLYYHPCLCLLVPPPEPPNLYPDDIIDFKDFAILANYWLVEQMWP